MDRLYITSISGRKLYLDDPQDCEFNAWDIIHSLSRLCRYNGHIHTGTRIYSVAQHSVLVTRQIMKKYKNQHALCLAALFHDSPEYVLGDVTGPLKRLLGPVYTDLEDKFASALEKWLGLPNGIFEHTIIKRYDLAIRRNEADSMCHNGSGGLCRTTDDPELDALEMKPIRCWTIRETEHRFWDLYQELIDRA